MASTDDRPAFSFLIYELEEGPKTYDAVIPRDFLAASLHDCDDVSPSDAAGALRVTLTKLGRQIVAVGTVKASVITACARCMQNATIRVEAKFDALAIPSVTTSPTNGPNRSSGKRLQKVPVKPAHSTKAAHSSHDDDDENDITDAGPDTICYEGEHLVLDDVVRDAIVLEIPMMPLCSETCAGIERAPVSEDANGRSADPRFAALLSVKPGPKA